MSTLHHIVGAIAVYKLHHEFQLILREAKNGMISPVSYILSKTILILPIMIVFSLLAIAIPGFILHGYSGFGSGLILLALYFFVMESIAECTSVWFGGFNVMIALVAYGCIWGISLLFSGIVLPFDEMFMPFTILYYVLPYQNFLRGFIHATMANVEFEPCNVFPTGTPCVDSTNGEAVLNRLGDSFPLITANNTIGTDMATLFIMGVAYKVIYAVGVIYRANRSSRIQA